jgi:hypothetical protein
LPEASPEPPPAPKTEPLPEAALARGLFYGSRLLLGARGVRPDQQ